MPDGSILLAGLAGLVIAVALLALVVVLLEGAGEGDGFQVGPDVPRRR